MTRAPKGRYSARVPPLRGSTFSCPRTQGWRPGLLSTAPLGRKATADVPHTRSSPMTPPDTPAGAYQPEPDPPPARRAELIAEIEALPAKARAAVAGLTPAQLDTKYKNWTVRQIVHHLADSHVNAFVRFRLTLTEETPTIK